jgi:hypothetical protein
MKISTLVDIALMTTGAVTLVAGCKTHQPAAIITGGMIIYGGFTTLITNGNDLTYEEPRLADQAYYRAQAIRRDQYRQL